MKFYVGVQIAQFVGDSAANNSPYNRSQARQVFESATTPTIESHGGRFAYVIGPFKTKRGAEFMARYGAGNPHCQTVDEAEKLSREKGIKT